MVGEYPLPKCLEGEPLPEDYYAPIDPYAPIKDWNINLPKLARYADKKGVPITQLTKEEVEQFRTK